MKNVWNKKSQKSLEKMNFTKKRHKSFESYWTNLKKINEKNWSEFPMIWVNKKIWTVFIQIEWHKLFIAQFIKNKIFNIW